MIPQYLPWMILVVWFDIDVQTKEKYFTPLPNRIKSNVDNWQEFFIQGTKANIVFGWDTSQIWDISQISIKNMTRISWSMISTVWNNSSLCVSSSSQTCVCCMHSFDTGVKMEQWRVNNTMETTILRVFPHNTFFVCFLITLYLCVSS